MSLNRAHVVTFEGRVMVLRECESPMATKHARTLGRLQVGTLHQVNYETTQGKHQIIFDGKGLTSAYNVNVHGGGLKFRSWLGFERGIWVHSTGLATEG